MLQHHSRARCGGDGQLVCIGRNGLNSFFAVRAGGDRDSASESLHIFSHSLASMCKLSSCGAVAQRHVRPHDGCWF